MPITYDITKDSLYLKGMKDAEASKKKQWEVKGKQKKAKEMISSLLILNKLSIKEIATVADTTVEYVLKVKAELDTEEKE